jgi:hypothetical protein
VAGNELHGDSYQSWTAAVAPIIFYITTVGSTKIAVQSEMALSALPFGRSAAVSQTSRSAIEPAAADASCTAALQEPAVKLLLIASQLEKVAEANLFVFADISLAPSFSCVCVERQGGKTASAVWWLSETAEAVEIRWTR